MRFVLPILLAACAPITPDDRVTLPDEIPVSRGTSTDAALADAVDAALLPVMETGAVGWSVAIVRDGEVAYAAGYGWADVEAGIPLTADTPVLLSSVSKTFVGVAAMQAVERGVLELDDAVSDLVDFDVVNPKRPDDTVTLRHLLTHHSGLHDTPAYGAAYTEGETTVQLPDFVEGYVSEGGDHWRSGNWAARDPGERFDYSNVGMALAAHAIAAAQDTTFDALLQRDLLDPLGMTNSSYRMDGLDLAPAVPYSRRLAAYEHYSYPTYPDGLMRSSAESMGRYLAAMQAGGNLGDVQVLTEASHAEMMTVDPALGTDEDGQAIAWAQLAYVPGRALMGHSGGDFGSLTLLGYDPDADVGVVVLGNSHAGDLRELFSVYGTLFDLADTP
jgi:CubicO group peptidase (beta-lactamase class C family)